MSAMEMLEELVRSSGEVGEGDPGVLILGEALPAYEVFVPLAELSGLEDRLDGEGSGVVFGEAEGYRVGRGVKFRRGVVWFKEGDMEYWVEAR